MSLPVFKMTVEDNEDGINTIAFVEYPAIERNFLKFSKNPGSVKFKIDSEEKRIVSGALLLADTPIYRREGDYEYYVFIDKDQVFKAVQKFFKEGRQGSTNREHTTEFFDGVTLFESFIIDSTRGIKAPEGYGELTEGSWFGSFKVENEDVWQAIKDGTFKGFSIEGFFSFKELSLKKAIKQTPLQELVAAIEELQKAL